MSLSLYDISAGAYLQGLGGLSTVLERARAHAAENGANPDKYLDVSLAPDMWPLRKQIMVVEHHSRGALDAVAAGAFSPPFKTPPGSYSEAQEMIAGAHAAIAALKPEEINAMEGRDVVFQVGDRKMAFTAANFVQSLSLPNFYFHATTAYDILRAQGVPLSKLDYMGQLRLKA